MKMFSLKTEMHKFSTVKEFVEEFNICQTDLLVTNEFLYTPFMKDLNLKCQVLFQEKYGVGEPTLEMIEAIFNDIQSKDVKRIIGIGGGTIIDISKILILKKPNNFLDLYDKKEVPVKDKELVIVPTTCGTGSEVTNISVAIIPERHSKIGLVSNELIPDFGVLIPELVKTLPYKFFAHSSIDALIHAVESYISPKAISYTELYSVSAIEMILNGYKEILDKGPEYRTEIMEEFCVASNYAGIAFAIAGCGPVHALSFPLGGQYKVPHGESNYQLFTEVLKAYYRLDPTGKIVELNNMLRTLIGADENVDIYQALEVVLNDIVPKKQLREYGMKEEEIVTFTDSVIASQQRLLVNAHSPLSKEDMMEIYRNLY
ncbi:4-hydroxybutyrate dehydrogenase [Clostridium sp.]|uniref:4-hydroxybutyrate dehydrogenase n=1 Tax=Clostridium sp. TaxID=1506 RepID=UPI00321643EE